MTAPFLDSTSNETTDHERERASTDGARIRENMRRIPLGTLLAEVAAHASLGGCMPVVPGRVRTRARTRVARSGRVAFQTARPAVVQRRAHHRAERAGPPRSEHGRADDERRSRRARLLLSLYRHCLRRSRL